MITTEAWVLHKGATDRREPAELVREPFEFSEPRGEEVVVEPLFGCWEANMSHAIARRPVDICLQRQEDRVIIGNSGVVRVLQTGDAVRGLVEGDVCAFFGTGAADPYGYTVFGHAYDMVGSLGVLAKRTKVTMSNLLPLPKNSRYTLPQWAAFSLRYVTAWSNWRAAYGCYRVQMTEEDMPVPHVWGWGGGTTFAELDLARRHGCRATMISGQAARLRLIAATGIESVDRTQFENLAYDARRFANAPAERDAYTRSEAAFLRVVRERTNGEGVSIFLDYIGGPVTRATMKSLARQGLIASAGWKHGMDISFNRALACINRQSLVHTHYARYSEGVAAMKYAEATGWIPPVDGTFREWDEIPALARDYAEGRLETYFPIYRVNPV